MTPLLIFLGTYIVRSFDDLDHWRWYFALVGKSPFKSVPRGPFAVQRFAPIDLDHLQERSILTMDELP